METSSTKTLCFRSALLFASDSGVMCSATQAGLRVRRSKEDVREFAGRRSATGPGKPYWKRPLGSTWAYHEILIVTASRKYTHNRLLGHGVRPSSGKRKRRCRSRHTCCSRGGRRDHWCRRFLFRRIESCCRCRAGSSAGRCYYRNSNFRHGGVCAVVRDGSVEGADKALMVETASQ